jgi:hypothetical protein
MFPDHTIPDIIIFSALTYAVLRTFVSVLCISFRARVKKLRDTPRAFHWSSTNRYYRDWIIIF